MRWKKGKTPYYIASECGRFLICKHKRGSGWRYLLSDGDAIACVGTRAECESEAAKRVGGAV